jgi:hypothetical protein
MVISSGLRIVRAHPRGGRAFRGVSKVQSGCCAFAQYNFAGGAATRPTGSRGHTGDRQIRIIEVVLLSLSIS